MSTFTYVTYIASTREKVWTALDQTGVHPAVLERRLVESDWRVGSPVVVRHDYDEEIDGLGGTVWWPTGRWR
jgi:hypothetical protein